MERKTDIENDVVEIAIQGIPFEFELCGKEEQFGEHILPHLWMDRRLIYGQRDNSRRLNETLANCFWAICKAEKADRNAQNKQRYLLARLSPYMRGNASKKVFNDASISYDAKAMKALEAATEKLVALSQDQELMPKEFWQKTAILLGPPEWPTASSARSKLYSRIEKELLERGCQLLKSNVAAAHADVRARWEELIRRYGRRTGHEDEKQILNMLSYESRVAVHDCYGEVWNTLLRNFKKEGMPERAVKFHKLLHAHIRYVDQKTREQFNLFHGQPFSLHPGSGLLFKTKTGRQLVGDFLSNPSSESVFNRLLHAIFICLSEFARYHDDQAQRRKIDSMRKVSYDHTIEPKKD